jgi:hypothetical protein
MGGLVDDRIDLAIRDDSVVESSFIVRRLAYAEWTACASPDHVARHGLPTRPAELANHDCLVYVRGYDCDHWCFVDQSGTKSIPVSGSLRSSDPHVLRTAALSGQGLILLPDAMVSEDLQTGRLVRVLNGYSVQQAIIRAVYPSRRQLCLKVRTFVDFAAAAFGGSTNVDDGQSTSQSVIKSLPAASGCRFLRPPHLGIQAGRERTNRRHLWAAGVCNASPNADPIEHSTPTGDLLHTQQLRHKLRPAFTVGLYVATNSRLRRFSASMMITTSVIATEGFP